MLRAMRVLFTEAPILGAVLLAAAGYGVGWVLRYELSDIFEQIVITLRDRLAHRVEVLEEGEAEDSKPKSAPAAAVDDEESAL